MMRRQRLILWAAVVVAVLTLAACSDDSSNLPVTRVGRTFDVTVLALERLPELRYSEFFQTEVLGHFRVRPSQEGMELVLARLQVGNHTAVSAIVDVDTQAVELRDFIRGKYFAILIARDGETWGFSDAGWDWVSNALLEQAPELPTEKDIPDPPGWEEGSVRVIELQADGGTLPGQGFLAGSFRLDIGFSIDGWIVFEAPKGTEFRELIWRAGDFITIEF